MTFINPYNYGRRIVNRTFKELAAEPAKSYATNETHIAAAAAKRGLIALVKENPKDFYTQVGKKHLETIRISDNLSDPAKSTLLTTTLLHHARNMLLANKSGPVTSSENQMNQFIKDIKNRLATE